MGGYRMGRTGAGRGWAEGCGTDRTVTGVYRLQSRQNQGGQRVAVRAKGYGAGQTVVGVAEVVGQENGCGGRQNG